MNKIMKCSDLIRRWADVIDMCEETVVNPEDCVKWNGEKCGLSFLKGIFASSYSYTFAIAIVEGRPVFVGDVLYHRTGGMHIVNAHTDIDNLVECYSWNQPKTDEYTNLKQAQNEGKRIAWFNNNAWNIKPHILTYNDFLRYPINRWKIVEDDRVEETHVFVFNAHEKIKFTKSGLTGKTTAEVIE